MKLYTALIEDDMAIPIEVKVPILKAFHKHIYDPSWKFVCNFTILQISFLLREVVSLLITC